AMTDPALPITSVHRKPAEGGKRLLVSYGGSDPRGEKAKARRAIEALKPDDRLCGKIGTVDVVAGLTDPGSVAIVRARAGIPGVVVHRGLSSLAPLMRRADLVLTPGGHTMGEGLGPREPRLLTRARRQQAMMAGELDAAGLIRSLGHHATVTPGAVLEMIARVLADFDGFAGRVVSAAPFDHLGSRRIAAAMFG